MSLLSQDVPGMGAPGAASKRQLDAFFFPRSIAVIGATDKTGHLGRTVMWNLVANASERTIYPVNHRKSAVFGIRAYPDIGSVPAPVDLAIVVTPAETVPGMIRECGQAGVRGAIVLSAGFRETGERGLLLEQETVANARAAGIRLIGPNCLGVMYPHSGLNATFAPTMASPGRVALISQSGTILAAVLDWSLREHVGLSALISVGSMADVGWGDLIDYLGDDPETSSIMLYMESIGNARSFLSAAREVALDKPIIVIKAGRTQDATRAAAAHTGALTGSDDVLDAAFRRVGVLRVNTIADVFFMTEVLGQQPRPSGPRLAIVTNAGGPGVIATDALLSSGGTLATLSPQTLAGLNNVLPPHWSHGNPVDILGDAGPERYEKAVEFVAKDPSVDGLLVIMTPQGTTNPEGVAEKLQRFARIPGRPVLASWMGGVEANQGQAILNRAGIPTFPFPDTAASAFQFMWRYSHSLDELYQTPTLPAGSGRAPDRTSAEGFIQAIKDSGRTILTELESKQLLRMYGIPTVDTLLATSEDEAVRLAAEIGYPVAIKLNSHTVTDKADVGGVQLNLKTEAGVRTAWRAIEASVLEQAGPGHFGGVTVQSMIEGSGYELILGSSIDPQFGPVLLFGSGGRLVELIKDTAVGLPPLNSTLALRLMEQTRVLNFLKGGHGGKSVDLSALEQLLISFSHLVGEQRWVKEIDINPLFASPEQLIALDARVILHDLTRKASELPKPAIRPYPDQYIKEISTSSGTRLTIRPIRPEDEPMMVRFHTSLSERSVYFRYFNSQTLERRIEHKKLIRSCFIDYDRQMALVAERSDPSTGDREIVGLGTLVRSHTENEAELAAAVIDAVQRRGIGLAIAEQLIEFARAEKIEKLTAVVLLENRPMRAVLERVGFVFPAHQEGDVLECEMKL
jgi:acetyltransferase